MASPAGSTIATCSTTRPRSSCAPAPAATGWCRCGARRTCRRAGPTAATAAAEARSCSWPTRPCATWPASAADRTSRRERGGHGKGAGKHGATPDPLVLRVPPGTVVEDADGDARWDLLSAGQRAVVARGGMGGRGNRHFATSTRQTPRFAERGLPGRGALARAAPQAARGRRPRGAAERRASRRCWPASRAPRPKVADYPFTTLEPVLGTLEAGERQLVLADIPGLIEGASGGAGLGHEFLAHVERCRLLRARARPPAARRLRPGGQPRDGRGRAPRARARPGRRCRGSSASRRATSLPAGAAWTPQWRSGASGPGAEVLATSAATGAGLDELAAAIARRVPMEDDGPGGRRGRRAAGHPQDLPPGRGRRDHRRAHRGGGLRGARAAARAADRPARREQRRGHALRGGAPARARRDQGARGRRASSPATTWRSPASCSSSIPALRSGRSQPVPARRRPARAGRSRARARAAAAAATATTPSRWCATSSTATNDRDSDKLCERAAQPGVHRGVHRRQGGRHGDRARSRSEP